MKHQKTEEKNLDQKLAKELEKEVTIQPSRYGIKSNRSSTDILMEVRYGDEKSKQGLTQDEAFCR